MFPYEKGENKPYDRSKGKTQRRAAGQEGRIKSFRFYHDFARQRAGQRKETLGFNQFVVRHFAAVLATRAACSDSLGNFRHGECASFSLFQLHQFSQHAIGMALGKVPHLRYLHGRHPPWRHFLNTTGFHVLIKHLRPIFF